MWAGSDGGEADRVATGAYVFASVVLPVDTSASVGSPPANLRSYFRLSPALGTRPCGVHEGELAALLACVSRAPLGVSIQIALDRVALLDLVDNLGRRSRRDAVRCNCQPLEERLLVALRGRDEALADGMRIQQAPVPDADPPWRITKRNIVVD